MASDSPTAGKDLCVGESFPLSGTAADHETNFLQLTPGATPNADVEAADLLLVSASLRSLIPENAGEQKDSDSVLFATAKHLRREAKQSSICGPSCLRPGRER